MKLLAQEWRDLARESAEAVADLTLKATRRLEADALNTLLERAGERLCAIMLAEGLPHADIEAALDAMASAFEARIAALDQGACRSVGQA